MGRGVIARRHDVAVVGGGPAGLALAIRARLHGLSVIVLDRGEPGHEKACGEGLMPRAVRHLAALGARFRDGESRPFRGIRFVQESGGRMTCATGRFPGMSGLGVRRPVLHAELARRAAEAGADLRWGVKASGLADGLVLAGDDEYPARFVVGADGLHSRVRRWAGLDAGVAAASEPRWGIRRHYRVAPWSDCVEVWWRDGAEAYVTPVAPDLVGVNVTWSGEPPEGARLDALLRGFPALAARLDGAEIVTEDRGAGPMRQDVRGVVAGRVALLGDASGYLDSIAGEGLALAFAQGHVLARALRAGDLRAYARDHARVSRVPKLSTAALLALARHPFARRRALGALARVPGLFTGLLAATSAGGPSIHHAPAEAPLLPASQRFA